MTELHRLRSEIESDDALLSQAQIERYVDLLVAARVPTALPSSGAGSDLQGVRGRGRERIAHALRSQRTS